MAPITRSTVKGLGLIWAFVIALFFLVIWLAAYVSEQKAVTFAINRLGEAPLELVAWAVVVPVLTLALHYFAEDGV